MTMITIFGFWACTAKHNPTPPIQAEPQHTPEGVENISVAPLVILDGVTVQQRQLHGFRQSSWDCQNRRRQGHSKVAKQRHQLKNPLDWSQIPIAIRGPKPAISNVIFKRSGDT